MKNEWKLRTEAGQDDVERRLQAEREREDRHHDERMDILKQIEKNTRVAARDYGSSTARDAEIEIQDNYIKLHVSLQILVSSQVAKMFHAPLATTIKPTKIIVEAARFAIGSDKPMTDVKRFLAKKILDSSKSKPFLSIVVQSDSRAIEAIRSHFVKDFLHALPSESPLNPIQDGHCRKDQDMETIVDNADDGSDCEDDERKREWDATKIAALKLHDSGEYKVKPEYDICWEKAWLKAHREARLYGTNYRDNLLKFRDSASLRSIPKAGKDKDALKIVSIFSLALLRMKVGKGIQMMASGDRSGLRQSHAPQWTKEVMRLHRKLKHMRESNNDQGGLILGNEMNAEGGRGNVGTEIEFGNLWVSRLLTEDEEDKLDDF